MTVSNQELSHVVSFLLSLWWWWVASFSLCDWRITRKKNDAIGIQNAAGGGIPRLASPAWPCFLKRALLSMLPRIQTHLACVSQARFCKCSFSFGAAALPFCRLAARGRLAKVVTQRPIISSFHNNAILWADADLSHSNLETEKLETHRPSGAGSRKIADWNFTANIIY